MTAQREHDQMKPAKPGATERSEGGSNRRARPKLLTEQLVVRLSKAELHELEQWADENNWTLANAMRVALHRAVTSRGYD
jgi:hypothetical protein